MAMANECPNCGGHYDSTDMECPYCGTPIERQVHPEFTPNYSQPVRNYQQTAPYAPAGSKNRIAAAILGIVLGALGVQWFYLGKTGLGILCILFCWTYIPGLVGLVLGIIWLTQDDATFAAKYG